MAHLLHISIIIFQHNP